MYVYVYIRTLFHLLKSSHKNKNMSERYFALRLVGEEP